MKRFENRTVIVTGGARGMGASHARGFVAEGANVVIADVLEQEGRTLADALGDHAIFSRLDVTSDRDWAATVAAAEDAFGPVSVLVNNAGIVRFAPIAETEPAAWRQVIDINLTGTFLGIREIVPSSCSTMIGGSPRVCNWMSSLRACRRLCPFRLGGSGSAGNTIKGQARVERFVPVGSDSQLTLQVALSEPLGTFEIPDTSLDEDNGMPNLEGRIALGLGEPAPIGIGLLTQRPLEVGVSGVAGQLRRTAFPPTPRRVVSDVWGAAVDFRVNLAGGLLRI